MDPGAFDDDDDGAEPGRRAPPLPGAGPPASDMAASTALLTLLLAGLLLSAAALAAHSSERLVGLTRGGFRAQLRPPEVAELSPIELDAGDLALAGFSRPAAARRGVPGAAAPASAAPASAAPAGGAPSSAATAAAAGSGGSGGRVVLSVHHGHKDVPDFSAPPASDGPSWLVLTAAYGGGREAVRAIFFESLAGLCAAGQAAALHVDAANLPEGSYWERAVRCASGGGGRGAAPEAAGAADPPCTPLGCARRSSPFQAAIRYHPRSVGDFLTGMHVRVVWRNRLRFSHFAYVEDDLGWTPSTLLALQAELATLDRQLGGDGTGKTAVLGHGLLPGLVRWEAAAGHEALNDPRNRTGPDGVVDGRAARMNDVPFDAIAPNDLNWRPAMGVRSRVRIDPVGAAAAAAGGSGGGAAGVARTYWEPRNPFAASWVLPRELLVAAWAGARPSFTHNKMIKEYFGGCWLYAQPFAYGPPPKNFSLVRKLLPCERGRLRALLALHNSGSKYTLGDGARYSVGGTLEAMLAQACPADGPPPPDVRSAQWNGTRHLRPEAKKALRAARWRQWRARRSGKGQGGKARARRARRRRRRLAAMVAATAA